MSNRVKIGLLGLVLIVSTAWIVYAAYTLFYKKIMHSTSWVIQVKPDSSAHSLVRQLTNKGLVDYPKLLVLVLRLSGKSERLQAGYYSVDSGISVWQLMKKVVYGDVVKREFTVIAGMNLSQVMNKLSQTPLLSSRPIDLDSFQKDKLSCEGLFLADTYQYVAGSEKQVLLQMANRELKKKLNYHWQHRKKDLPYTNAYQLLIAASIVEKETAIESERALISGVIVNRLRSGMRLQMDPTVIYALGAAYRGRLSGADLQINSPYNTYQHYGLPPTPIAMVSEESIVAAAHPFVSSYLYYVAKGDGSHRFSSDYRAHRQAVNQLRIFQARGE